MDVEEANCEIQRPFDDFIPLGDSVVAGGMADIEGNLNVMGYLRSAICEMTVMNADGYEYNGKNYVSPLPFLPRICCSCPLSWLASHSSSQLEFLSLSLCGVKTYRWKYWYRNVNSGQFELITYDQDTSFTVTEFIYDDSRTIWNWTQGLSDALFLPTFFEDAIVAKDYLLLLRSYVEQFYRSDGEGALFQRMEVLSEFIAEFNPERTGLLGKVESFQRDFIVPMSTKIQAEVNIASLEPLPPAPAETCDFTGTP